MAAFQSECHLVSLFSLPLGFSLQILLAFIIYEDLELIECILCGFAASTRAIFKCVFEMVKYL